MTINIEETGAGALNPDFDINELTKELLEAVSDLTNAEYELWLDVLLCDEDTIREINRDQRGIDAVTDVLSFPNLDFPAPGLWPEELEDDLFEPDSGELMLGNIALCKQKVISQAEEFGHSLKREYAFLITHSLLHLCAFDHMEDAERFMMEETQEAILTKLSITRD